MDQIAPPSSNPRVRSLGELLALSLATPGPLRAVWRDDRSTREIFMVSGEVLHARCGDLEGAPAIWAMLDEPPRPFTVEPGRVAPVRSVHQTWGRLCHEARCHLAERDRPKAEVIWVDVLVDDLAER